MNIKLPEINELTDEQIEILNIIDPVAIYGGAGTGKTILSIWKHILNWEQRNIKSFLITYTHTLTRYFELPIRNESLEASQNIENIDRFYDRNDIDMLIIDEAQDIPKNTHINFKKKYQNVSYSSDDKQILYPKKQTTQNELNQIYQVRNFVLSKNFRNSYEILAFVRDIFPYHGISDDIMEYAKNNRQTGQKPILFYSNNENDLITLLNKLDNTKRIAILVPTIDIFNIYKDILDNHQIYYSDYNYQQKGNIRNNNFSNIHLTIFKSSKGLEFDIVIMPDFEQIDYFSDYGIIVKKNDYYVAMTRAREQLFLLSNDKNILNNISPNLYDVEDI